MTFVVKHFSELTTMELWQIYELRNRVFIVEQECIYQDIDAYDKVSYHIMALEENELVGYTRVLPKNTTFEDVSVGRVISMKRRSGLGTKLVQAAIDVAREHLDATRITIEAQTYAVKLYESVGFRAEGEEFLEDGIPHIKIIWEA